MCFIIVGSGRITEKRTALYILLLLDTDNCNSSERMLVSDYQKGQHRDLSYKHCEGSCLFRNAFSILLVSAGNKNVQIKIPTESSSVQNQTTHIFEDPVNFIYS